MITRSAARSSSGLPRKRPSYDLDDVRPSRPTKKIRRLPKKEFPLMALPAEIRLRILRELLLHDEPLKATRAANMAYVPRQNNSFTGVMRRPCARSRLPRLIPREKSFDFAPNVLRVCRQLNQEGTPILYKENTIDVTVDCRHSPDGMDAKFMGQDVGRVRDIDGSVRLKTEKLRITVKIEDHCTPYDERETLRQLVPIIRDTPNWTHLSISILDRRSAVSDSDSDSDSDSEISEDENDNEEDEEDEEPEPDFDFDSVLRPFGLLRRMRHVELKGCSEQYGVELKRLMQSDDAVVDLPEMLQRLYDYIAHRHSRDQDDGETIEALKAAEAAVDQHDVPAFLQAREKVMWRIDESFARSRSLVFQHDLDRDSAGADMQTYVLAQLKRELQQKKSEMRNHEMEKLALLEILRDELVENGKSTEDIDGKIEKCKAMIEKYREDEDGA